MAESSLTKDIRDLLKANQPKKLTPIQQAKVEEKALLTQQQQASIDARAMSQLEGYTKQIAPDGEKHINVLRPRGIFDGLRVNRAAKRVQDLSGDQTTEEYQVAKRAYELSQQFADEAAAKMGQETPAYLNLPKEYLDDLDKDETGGEIFKKVLATAVESTVGAVQNIANANPFQSAAEKTIDAGIQAINGKTGANMPTTAETRSFFMSALNGIRNKAKGAKDSSTDLGSLRAQLVLDKTRRDWHEGKIPWTTATGQMIANVFNGDDDLLADLGVTAVGVGLGGGAPKIGANLLLKGGAKLAGKKSGGVSLTKLGEKAGLSNKVASRASQTLQGAYTGQLAMGMNYNEETTPQQSFVYALTGMVAGGLPVAAGAVTAESGVSSLLSRATGSGAGGGAGGSFFGGAARGAAGEGAQEALEATGETVANLYPDGGFQEAFESGMTPQFKAALKVNTVTGLVLGSTLGSITGATGGAVDNFFGPDKSKNKTETKKAAQEIIDKVENGEQLVKDVVVAQRESAAEMAGQPAMEDVAKELNEKAEATSELLRERDQEAELDASEPEVENPNEVQLDVTANNEFIDAQEAAESEAETEPDPAQSQIDRVTELDEQRSAIEAENVALSAEQVESGADNADTIESNNQRAAQLQAEADIQQSLADAIQEGDTETADKIQKELDKFNAAQTKLSQAKTPEQKKLFGRQFDKIRDRVAKIIAANPAEVVAEPAQETLTQEPSGSGVLPGTEAAVDVPTTPDQFPDVSQDETLTGKQLDSDSLVSAAEAVLASPESQAAYGVRQADLTGGPSSSMIERVERIKNGTDKPADKKLLANWLNRVEKRRQQLINRDNSRSRSSLSRGSPGNVEALADGASNQESVVGNTKIVQSKEDIPLALTDINAPISKDLTPQQSESLGKVAQFYKDLTDEFGLPEIQNVFRIDKLDGAVEGGYINSRQSGNAIGLQDVEVLLDPKAPEARRARVADTVAHEFGHHTLTNSFFDATKNVQRALLKDFRQYLNDNAINATDEDVQLWVKSGSLVGRGAANAEGPGTLDGEYARRFEEYAAQRISAALEADGTTLKGVDKYFGDLGNLLRQVMESVKARFTRDGVPSRESDELFINYLEGLRQTRDLRQRTQSSEIQLIDSIPVTNTGNFDFVKIGKDARNGIIYDKASVPLADARVTIQNVPESRESVRRGFLQPIKLLQRTPPNDLPVKLAESLAKLRDTADPQLLNDISTQLLELDGEPSLDPKVQNFIDAGVRNAANSIRRLNASLNPELFTDRDLVDYFSPQSSIRAVRKPMRRNEMEYIDKDGKKVVQVLGSTNESPRHTEPVTQEQELSDDKSELPTGPNRTRGQIIKDSKIWRTIKEKVENSQDLARTAEQIWERNILRSPELVGQVREELSSALESIPSLKKLMGDENNFKDNIRVNTPIATQDSRAETFYSSLQIGRGEFNTLEKIHGAMSTVSDQLRALNGNSRPKQQNQEDHVLTALSAREVMDTDWAMENARPTPETVDYVAEERAYFNVNDHKGTRWNNFVNFMNTSSNLSNAGAKLAEDYKPGGLNVREIEERLKIIEGDKANPDVAKQYAKLSELYQKQLRFIEGARGFLQSQTIEDRQTRSRNNYQHFLPIPGTKGTDQGGMDQYFREQTFAKHFLTDNRDVERKADSSDSGQDLFLESPTARITNQARYLMDEIAGQRTTRALFLAAAASELSPSYRGFVGSHFATSGSPNSRIQEIDLNSVEGQQRIKDQRLNTIIHYTGDGKALIMDLNDDAAVAAKGKYSSWIHSLEQGEGAGGKAFRGMRNTTRFLARQLTWYNPAFVNYDAMRNVINTVPMLALENDTERGDVQEFIRDAIDMSSWKDMALWISYQQNSTPANLRKQQELIEKSPHADKLELMAELYREGGPTVISRSFGTNKLQDNKLRDTDLGRDITSKLPAELVANAKSVDNAFEVYNAAAEMISRLAYYKVLRNRGIRQDVAAARTKDITNFENKGEWGGLMGAAYTFARAAAIGNVKLIDNMLESKHATKGIVLLSALGAMEYMMVKALFGGEDEDGRNKVAEMDGRLMTKNMVFFVGDTPFRRSFGFGPGAALQSMGAQLAKLFSGDQTTKEAATNIWASTVDTFNILPQGSQGGLLNPIRFLPSAARPLGDLFANINGLGMPIRDPFKEDRISFTKGAAFAGKTGKIGSGTDEFVKWLHDQTGGAVSLNPDDVDHLMSSYLNSVYSIGRAGMENIRNLFPDDEDTVQDIENRLSALTDNENTPEFYKSGDTYQYDLKRGAGPANGFMSSYFTRQASLFYRECPSALRSGELAEDDCKKVQSSLNNVSKKYSKQLRNRAAGAGRIQRLKAERAKEREDIYREFNYNRGLATDPVIR